MSSTRTILLLAAVIVAVAAGSALADPNPNEALKFYQMPLNNGLTPYLPGVPSYPAPSTNGYPPYGTVPSTAPYPGHDEWSTANAVAYGPDPNNPGQPIPIQWQGQYMADDFADYAGTPVVHVRWWGSYQQGERFTGVKKFLISFEHDVPASVDPVGNPIPSHPDFFNPGNVHQIVDLVGGAAPPPAGFFTESFVPTPGGAIPSPDGALWEYNAELHPDKYFFEHAATPTDGDDVYWLKIVALVDPSRDGPLMWGWHDRDWSIPDALAAVPPAVIPGEFVEGVLPPGPPGQPVYHFQDDAVQGGITLGIDPITPGGLYMPTVTQDGFTPQNYIVPFDGPTPIQQFSKDLAFELYTIVPEPASLILFGLGAIGLVVVRRRLR